MESDEIFRRFKRYERSYYDFVVEYNLNEDESKMLKVMILARAGRS